MTVEGISHRSWHLLSSGFAARALIFLTAAQAMAISAEEFAHDVNLFVPPAIQSFVIGMMGGTKLSSGFQVIKRGSMEMLKNGVEQVTEAASGMSFSDVALRFALWVVYGGEAGELVYRSNSIQEGFGTLSADCPSHHAS